MGSYRIIKRGVLFGAEGDVITRADFAEESEVETSLVTGSGKPVPVVFGSRFVEPTIVNWAGLGDRITWYYEFDRSTGRIDYYESPPADAQIYPMTVLSMRMVLCLGGVEKILHETLDGVEINIVGQPLPPLSTGPIITPIDIDTWNIIAAYSNTSILRLVVVVGDADVLGRDAGGLGIPGNRDRWGPGTHLSEFFYTTGAQATNPVYNYLLDKNTAAYGVTSFVFFDFNFGGKRPLAKWRVAVQRTQTLTARDPSGQYLPQWERELSTVSDLKNQQIKNYYLVVLDRTLDGNQRQLIKDYVTRLPYTDTTEYQIIELGYYSFPSGARFLPSVSAVYRTRVDFIVAIDSYVVNGTDQVLRTQALNLDGAQTRTIVDTYAYHIRVNITSPVNGIVMLFASFSNMLVSGINYTEELGKVTSNLLQLQFPEEGGDIRDINVSAIRRVQPQVKVISFNSYYSSYSYSYSIRRVPLPALSIDTYGAFLYALPSTSPSYFPPANFPNLFAVGLTYGLTMNPVHALREALIDKDWGEGIDESLIDNGSFLLAARTCKAEGLDYCYVYDQLGGVEKLVKQITDYIDGIVYYESATNKIRLKLIREDYSFSSIPSFDESNISEIKKYQRQHSDETVNSVTIKYHDAASDSEDTVTVHNLEASHRAGKIVSVTLNYPGCAQRSAAVAVAERELTALSRALISFTARINPTEILGLGDPVLVSYQDLGIARVVMRVSKIDYGDGLTGGVDVELIQDVFADLTAFGDLIGDEPLPDDTPQLVQLQDNVLFLESSQEDLSSISYIQQFAADPAAKFIKAGLRDSPLINDQTIVTIGGRVIGVGIGSLLHDIPMLSSDPNTQSISVYISCRTEPTAESYIRINDEVMQIGKTVYKITDNIYEIIIVKRAQHDTVGHAHAHASDVWLLDKLWNTDTKWDGSPVVSNVQQGIYTDRELLTPNISFIGRANLPLPPEYLRVDGKYLPSLSVDGDINVVCRPRPASRARQETLLVLSRGATEIFRRTVAIGSLSGGVYSEQTIHIGSTLIENAVIPETDVDLSLSVGAIFGGRVSWQMWQVAIDWSSRDRSNERQGWNYNWGNDWGGGSASGWGYDWGNDWGD